MGFFRYYNMIIFRPSSTTQTFTIIPRYNAENVTVIIKNKELDNVDVITTSTTFLNGYMTISINYNVKEDYSYNIEIKDSETVIYRDVAYATDETDLQNYKISKNLQYE